MLFSKMADIKQQMCCVQMLIKPLFWSGGMENQLLILTAVPSSSHSSLILLYGHNWVSSLWKSLKISHPPWTWSTLSNASRQTLQTSPSPIGLHLSACVSCTYLYNVSIDTGGVFRGEYGANGVTATLLYVYVLLFPFFLLIFALDLWEAYSMKRKKKHDRPTDDHKKGYAKCWGYL